jgi:hypothetical protein
MGAMRCSTLASALLLCALSTPALAENDPERRDPAAAEALFMQGRDALARGDLKTACAKFGESYALEPAAGTLMNWATCEGKLGRLASAWQRWREALERLEPDDDRVAFVRQQAQDFEARLPYLTIRLAPTSPKATYALRNGVRLGAASFGVSLPVDPGEHRIVAEAPGHAPKTFTVTLAERERKELVIVPGARLPDPPAPEPEQSGRSSWRSTAGFVAGGVGLAGIGAAVVTGLLLPARRDSIEQNCMDKLCTQAGLDAASEGRTLLLANTIGWAAGVVGVGLGAYLVISDMGGSEREPQAVITVRSLPLGAGVSYERRF